MAKRRRCQTCKGTYSPQRPDGALYFHACPPETIETPAPPGRPDLSPTFESREREGKRDENFREELTRDAEGHIRARAVAMVSEGLGVEELED